MADRDSELDRHDRQHALSHELDRMAPSRRDRWPKDDRRSSERIGEPPDALTPLERESRWPIG
jgi:hypothetical protein